MRTPYAAGLAALLLLTACGTESSTRDRDVHSNPPAAAIEKPTAVPAAEAEITTGSPVTVLDDGDGAEACLGGVLTSLPPQCGGPRLLGWDWADHAGDFEEAGGTRWGDFVITGTFDGRDIGPTEVVPAAQWDPPAENPDDDLFATPCPEPDGGWRPIDPVTTTDRTEQQAMRIARNRPDYAGSWVDQSINPASDDEPSGIEWEMAMNDPKLLVLNVAVTGSVVDAEAAIREVWGGALCVSEARHSDRELAAVQDDTNELAGILSSGRDIDRVDVSVVYDDGSLQAWVDQEYGEGVVEVSSALMPVDG